VGSFQVLYLLDIGAKLFTEPKSKAEAKYNSIRYKLQFWGTKHKSHRERKRERERERREIIPGIENDWGKQIKEEQVLTKN
jgi:hypothetical protein